MAEEEKKDKPVFKMIKSFEMSYGTRNFVEVALKETNDGENIFFSISKGFITKSGAKKYKKSLGFEASEDVQAFVVESLGKLLEEFKKMQKEKKE